jgi:uncharacterized protein YbjT (DUF2867 family)
MTATVFGATGLVGSVLIEQLINDKRFTTIKAIVRKKGVFNDAKIIEVETDFSKSLYNAVNTGQEIYFCCLGTTLKKAGSKSAQQIVDRDYPIEIAKQAEALGVNKMICVSSVGADSSSNNFYLKTKGEMEVGVASHMHANAIFVRPSMILSDRKEKRIGEKIGKVFMTFLNPLFVGSLKKYKSIDAHDIAQAMIYAAFNNVSNIMDYELMIQVKN